MKKAYGVDNELSLPLYGLSIINLVIDNLTG